MDTHSRKKAEEQVAKFKTKFFVWINSLSPFKKILILIITYGLFQVTDLVPTAIDDMLLTLGYILYVIGQVDKADVE